MTDSRSSSAAGTGAFLTVLASVTLAGPLAAQASGSCGISARVGAAIPSAEVRRVEPFQEEEIVTGDVLEAGLALGADLSCPVAGPWTAGAGVERLDLEHATFWHLTASAGARTSPAPGLAISGRVRAGWRIAEDHRVFPAIPVDFEDDLVAGDDGPTVGLDVRLENRLEEGMELFAEAGVRAGRLERRIRDFESAAPGTPISELTRTDTETVLVFPITGGVTVRF